MKRFDLRGHARTGQRVFMLVLSACSAAFIGLFYLIALKRFRFPGELEWAEGGMLDGVRRVFLHQPLYVAPSPDYMPFMYTPIYYWINASLCHFMGLGYAPLRLISIIATTGCFIMIFLLVLRLAKSRFAALLAVGTFAALYGQANSWFDLARVDMVYLFFLLISIYLSQRGWPIWAAIAFAVAFQTKQSAAAVAILVLSHEIRRPRKMVFGLGLFALLATCSYWWINRQSDGWYRYYTTFLPAHQAWVARKLASFCLRDLADPLGLAIALIALVALLHLSASSTNARQRYFVLFTTVGIFISSLTARLHLGGTTNVTIPLYAWICILLGLSIHLLLVRVKDAPEELAAILPVGILLACLVQFAQLFYSANAFVPNAVQTKEAADIQRKIAAIHGEVFVFHNVVDGGLSGKLDHGNSMGIWDVLRADHSSTGQKLKADLIRSFEDKKYAAVISDGPLDEMTPEESDWFVEVTSAAKAAYPFQQRLLTPAEELQFYASPTTPTMKPIFLYSAR